MKKVFGVIFIFAVGAILGYLYSQSRDTKDQQQFEEANDSDHNNRQNQEKTTLTSENGKSNLPKQRAIEEKTDPALPKPRKLDPPSVPEIKVNTPVRAKSEKKSTEETSPESYAVFTPGLNGTVKLTTPIPKSQIQTIKMTPECKKENSGNELLVESIVAGATGGLANVFVSIKEGLNSKATYPIPVEPVILNQQGCVYSPHVMAIRVNQALQILNSDPFLHNVNGMPKLSAKFNNGMATKGSQIEKKFTKAEDAVRIKCDVHPWMNAYVWVVDHPFYSITDMNGKFNIQNLPFGEYLLQIQHEKLGIKEKRITWGPDTKPIEFQF